MVANPGKFQYMLLGKHKSLKIEIGVFQLESAKLVNLLGITIDHDLTFDTHVQNICKTASAKVKSLSRGRNALEEKQAKFCITLIVSQFNLVHNEPHMSLEELPIRDQGISVHRKQINTLLTESYKTFSG